MGGRERMLQVQLDRRVAEVHQLRTALAQEAARVAARDHQIVQLKALAAWRAIRVELLVLGVGLSIGFFAGFVVFAERIPT